jgi:hypothetical protein
MMSSTKKYEIHSGRRVRLTEYWVDTTRQAVVDYVRSYGVKDDEIRRPGVDLVSWRGAQLRAELVPSEPAKPQRVEFADAVAIAARADGESRRPSGGLLVAHGVNVAVALGPAATATAMNAAVLHEILENTDWTIDELARSGVELVVCEAVDVLTRRSDETYMDYIRRICAAPGVAGETARQVKVADLTVSVDEAFSDTLRQRYEQSLPLVQGALATAVG